MEVNFFGPVALTKAVLPAMLARRAGHIVVISSLLGKFGMRGRSGYAASKHALHGYFESLRAEVHRADITITLVCPGYVDTDLPLQALNGKRPAVRSEGCDPQLGACPPLSARRAFSRASGAVRMRW